MATYAAINVQCNESPVQVAFIPQWWYMFFFYSIIAVWKVSVSLYGTVSYNSWLPLVFVEGILNKGFALLFCRLLYIFGSVAFIQWHQWDQLIFPFLVFTGWNLVWTLNKGQIFSEENSLADECFFVGSTLTKFCLFDLHDSIVRYFWHKTFKHK